MLNIINTENLPIKLWLREIDDDTLQQAKNIANLPFAYHHVAIMPDSHVGYGMPIGGVLAAKEAIVPNAVGVDIGCGMCSLKTNLQHIDRDDLKKIMGTIRKLVPVGFNHHDEKQDEKWMPELPSNAHVSEKEYKSALKQIGTLGGGNHFIEVQKGSDGFIWIMVHSGSRNIGYTVAGFYHKKAKELNEIWFDSFEKELAWFPYDTEEYHQYKTEMDFCIEFALQNRTLMMERIKESFVNRFPDIEFSDFINKPHNFASDEVHFGSEVTVHRKGATRARKGELGMIPGSQGTPSYIVKGKGNPESFESCSHGAGRVMSRNQAKKNLDLNKVQEELDEQGVLHAVRHTSDLDEAPGSYKDIRQVMKLQEDLVEIVLELQPLAVVKG